LFNKQTIQLTTQPTT